ncbi:MAG TPA: PepSY-like domain-containing protein [Chitinophagaceae bacterium]
MKKLLAFAVCLVMLNAPTFANVDPSVDNVNEKVLRAFQETFPVVDNVKWKEYDTYYTVSFKQNAIQSEVRYDKDGNFLSSLRYYKEDMLPLSVLHQLKKKYPTKSIFGVTELIVGTDVAYFVKLEDAKTWFTIKADQQGNLSVYEKMKKS